MDEAEARSILSRVAEELRTLSYTDLVRKYMAEDQNTEVAGASGVTYQVEVQAFWDDPRQPGSNLRVMASIDDGSFWRSVSPRTVSFIVAPDGTFVGE